MSKIVFFVLIVVVSTIAVWNWFSDNSILYFWDAYVPLDATNSFNNLFYLWRDQIFPGYSATAWSWLTYWGLFQIPSLVTPSLSIKEGFVYVSLLSLSIINFYFLCSHILHSVFKENKNRLMTGVVAAVISFLYAFNTYTFINFYFMFNPGAFILALLPLNLLALIHIYPLDGETNRGGQKKWLWTFFITLFFMSPGLGIQILLAQYIVWLVVYLLFFRFLSKRKILSRQTLELVLFFVLSILINLWWLFPTVLGLQEAYAGQSSFGTTIWLKQGFEPSQLLNSFRLIGSALMVNNPFDWTPLYFQNNLFAFPMFMLPFLFIISLVYLRRKKLSNTLIYFLAVLLVSLFVVKFNNPPFPDVFNFAFRYIPFFGAFRDSFQKAGVYFLPAYFIYIGIGLYSVVDYLSRRRLWLILSLFTTISLCAVVVISGPFFLFYNNNIRTQTLINDGDKYIIKAKTQVPPEYYRLKKFLESRCPGEVVDVIPRSGFVTDAIWNKYNSSYSGQDMLPSLISCRFLSAASFNGISEALIEVPYIHLAQDDYAAYKNYLSQNNIKYVLTRKDYLLQDYVNWYYIDPRIVEKLLTADPEFTRTYDDDFTSVFEKKNQPEKQYGFKLTTDVVSTQSELKTNMDFTAVSKVLGDVSQPVIINRKREQKLYKNRTTIFASVANCLGCLEVDYSKAAAFTEVDNSFPQILKRFLKSTVKSNKTFSGPLDMKISLYIADTNDAYRQLLLAIKNQNKNAFNAQGTRYIQGWKEIRSLIKELKADRFERNNKYIEANNYLTIERYSFFNYVTSRFLHDSFINQPENKKKVISLISFQDALLDEFKKTMMQTDLNKNLFKYRLDILHDGNYTCNNIVVGNGAGISHISIENQKLNAQEYTGEIPLSLKSGSYLVNLNYDPKIVLDYPITEVEAQKVKEIKIGKMQAAAYSINFKFDSLHEGKLLIAISQGKMKYDVIEHMNDLEKMGNYFMYVDSLDNEKSSYSYSRTFQINVPSSKDYYMYLYFLGKENTYYTLSDFTIKYSIRYSDVQFACGTKIPKIQQKDQPMLVTKNSPVRYTLTVPPDYNGFLTFNQTYDKDWIAYEEGSNKVFPHFESGYSSVWEITGVKSNNIIVEYKRQKSAEKVAVLSVFISLVTAFLYGSIRNLNNKKR